MKKKKLKQLHRVNGAFMELQDALSVLDAADLPALAPWLATDDVETVIHQLTQVLEGGGHV